MKRILSALLFVVLAITGASSLVGCNTTKYTITYHVEGIEGEPKTQTYSLSRKDVELWWPDDTATHYFDGWYATAECTGSEIEVVHAGSKENITLYGRMVATGGYTITYIIDGVQKTGVHPKEYKLMNTDLKLWYPQPADIEDGYYFSGWYEDADMAGTSVRVVPKDRIGDRVYYGSYIEGAAPTEHTVTFEIWDASIGTAGEWQVQTNADSIYIESNRAQALWFPSGYNNQEKGFDGWYTQKDFKGTRFDTIPAGTAPASTYYGRWRAPDGYAQKMGRTKADDFVLNGKTDSEIRLSDFIGRKPVLLNFWSSKCGPCRTEMPHFQKVYEKEKNNIEFLMINSMALQDTPKEAQDYIDGEGFTFPWYHDDGRGGFDKVYVTYKITGFPSTVIIDKWGYISYFVEAPISQATLEAEIANAKKTS